MPGERASALRRVDGPASSGPSIARSPAGADRHGARRRQPGLQPARSAERPRRADPATRRRSRPRTRPRSRVRGSLVVGGRRRHFVRPHDSGDGRPGPSPHEELADPRTGSQTSSRKTAHALPGRSLLREFARFSLPITHVGVEHGRERPSTQGLPPRRPRRRLRKPHALQHLRYHFPQDRVFGGHGAGWHVLRNPRRERWR